MDIEGYLKDKALVVNEALAGVLPLESARPQRLHKAMRYSVFAGGKRVRPVMAIAACEAVGGRYEDVIHAACAIECIHTYSLIHDDLPAMDDDDLRRGVPTCHKAFDEATAILAGDALLTIAFELMARMPVERVGAPGVLAATVELARGAGAAGMIGGQMIDMESEGKDLSAPELEAMHIRKTGALILASLRCGAILGGARPGELEVVSRYGEAVGLAFQVADDILDVEGDAALMGKASGMDAARGKATYPAVLGLSEARRRASDLSERAVAALDGFDDRAEPLRELARYIVERNG